MWVSERDTTHPHQAMIQHKQQRTARTEAFRHALVIEALMAKMLPKISEHVERGTWADAGSLGHAAEKMVEAAFALGAITEEEGAKLGVEL